MLSVPFPGMVKGPGTGHIMQQGPAGGCGRMTSLPMRTQIHPTAVLGGRPNWGVERNDWDRPGLLVAVQSSNVGSPHGWSTWGTEKCQRAVFCPTLSPGHTLPRPLESLCPKTRHTSYRSEAKVDHRILLSIHCWLLLQTVILPGSPQFVTVKRG